MKDNHGCRSPAAGLLVIFLTSAQDIESKLKYGKIGSFSSPGKYQLIGRDLRRVSVASLGGSDYGRCAPYLFRGSFTDQRPIVAGRRSLTQSFSNRKPRYV